MTFKEYQEAFIDIMLLDADKRETGYDIKRLANIIKK